MKIKHHEIIPNEEKPFDQCRLDREPFARILTEIVNTYADGFVMAINNKWGTGKTTFVKMWQQQLKKEDFKTVYFNAWENDFENNPLVAIMSELETLLNDKNEKIFKSVLQKGAILIRNIAPSLAKALIKKYAFDVDDVVVGAVESATKASTEILEGEIKEYISKKKSIGEFRKELENFVKTKETEKPLVFIIDELDRCRPNYSVEVLEQIKHFFSVEGIVFVLSIDKSHLASAVKGFYGSDQINTDEYLRRFIDLEYSIPQPSSKKYSSYLFQYYSFNDFFSSSERRTFHQFQNDADSLLTMAELLFTKSNATLRQQEKIFGQTRLILQTFLPNQYTFPHLLFLLIYIKTMNNEVYSKIERKLFSIQQLAEFFEDVLLSDSNNFYSLNTVYIEAIFLHFYNNYKRHGALMKLFETGEGNSITTSIKSKLEEKNVTLAACFKDISENWDYGDISLSYYWIK